MPDMAVYMVYIQRQTDLSSPSIWMAHSELLPKPYQFGLVLYGVMIDSINILFVPPVYNIFVSLVQLVDCWIASSGLRVQSPVKLTYVEG